jgi:hypothetical protein
LLTEKLTRPSTQWLLLALAVGLALAVALSMALAGDAEAKKKKHKPNTPPPTQQCHTVGLLTTACLAKTAPTKSILNKPLVFTITPSVPSGGAGGLSVTDTLPPGVTFVSATTSQGTCSQGAGKVTCGPFTLGPALLAAPTTGTILLVVIPNSPGTITNTASDNFGSVGVGGTNNTATTTVNVIKKKKHRHH